MLIRLHALAALVFLSIGFCAFQTADARPDATALPISIVLPPSASPRIQFGAARLQAALQGLGLRATVGRRNLSDASAEDRILIGKPDSFNLQTALSEHPIAAGTLKPEGFLLDAGSTNTTGGQQLLIVGADDSGVLYGCLELARQIKATVAFPPHLHLIDAPAFKLRGTCIGMQKPYILPGRHVYEYPCTPELFPFFYDKQFWQRYLDFLVEQRMNTLYLWSGHPFASLVKLPDYPFALEVPEDVYQKNVEMFRYIASEADKRGIWVVQMFYNILVSKPFAEHYGIKTQLSAPTPLVADYTRKSIAAFIQQYPNVGLMVCLGEALQGEQNQTDWLLNTILPGVKDGMAAAGLRTEPPIIIRTHATDLRPIMPLALKIYHNLYTITKYTGESLTTSEPRGKWQQIHLAMSHLGSTHVANIHILSNLEPFRYGDQRFIQQCMIAARDRLGAEGIHLYPLCYWNWPDSPDRTDPPLKQIDRDWIWFQSWARYSWNPDIPAAEDHRYWIDQIAARYGAAGAEDILAAYNDSGECAPRLIRRFGITEGNRQTLSLGMTLNQLVKPEKYSALPDLWESDAPPGERLQEYAEREWNHQPHQGETPPQIIKEVLEYSQHAVDEADAAENLVTNNREEFERLRDDVHCIQEMSQFYAAKANAALLVLRYAHSHDILDLKAAEPFLVQSVDDYRKLAKRGDAAYRFANSMQTSQRKIPVTGGIGGHPANYLWGQVLPVYEKELSDFQERIATLSNGEISRGDANATAKPLPKVKVSVLTGGQAYTVSAGATVFSDRPEQIASLAPQLDGLTGIRSTFQRNSDKPPIVFRVYEPVQLLVGYFRSSDKAYLQPPSSETDAAAAERGSTEPVIENAAVIPSLPPVDVFTQYYPAGQNTLQPHGDGSFIVLGVIPRSATISAASSRIPSAAATRNSPN